MVWVRVKVSSGRILVLLCCQDLTYSHPLPFGRITRICWGCHATRKREGHPAKLASSMCAPRLHVTLGETVISDLKRAVCKQKIYSKSDTRASGNPMAFNNTKAYLSSWPNSIGLPKKSWRS